MAVILNSPFSCQDYTVLNAFCPVDGAVAEVVVKPTVEAPLSYEVTSDGSTITIEFSQAVKRIVLDTRE